MTLPLLPLPPAAIAPSSGVAAGTTFTEIARAILASPIGTDTAASLADALELGESEFQRNHAELTNARKIATDPLSSDEEANAARGEIAGPTASMERIEASFKALTVRHTEFVNRIEAETRERDRRAIIARFEAAQKAVVERYQPLASEIAELLTELEAARSAAANARIKVDTAATRNLGDGYSGEAGNYLRLPKLDIYGWHWPLGLQ